MVAYVSAMKWIQEFNFSVHIPDLMTTQLRTLRSVQCCIKVATGLVMKCRFTAWRYILLMGNEDEIKMD